MSEAFEPPIKYLRNCSENSLRQYELAKLEHVSNLRRELRVLWEEMIEESALGLLARWMVENRVAIRSSIKPGEPAPGPLGDPLSPVFVAFDRCAAQAQGADATMCEPPAPAMGRPRLVEQGSPASGAEFSVACVPQPASAGRHTRTPRVNDVNGTRSVRKLALPVQPEVA